MYNHLTKHERDQIAIWKAEGRPYSSMASQLGRHKSTISREVKRNKDSTGQYLSCLAQDKSCLRKHKSHKRERISNSQIRLYVEEKLKLGRPPDIISGRIEIEHSSLSTSHECIYKYIYENKRELGVFLPRKRIKRRAKSNLRKAKKTIIPNKVSILERPEKVNKRELFGHYEADSMVSKESKTVLNVLVERK